MLAHIAQDGFLAAPPRRACHLRYLLPRLPAITFTGFRSLLF